MPTSPPSVHSNGERLGLFLLAGLFFGLIWSLGSTASTRESNYTNHRVASLPSAEESPTPCCDDKPHHLFGTYYSAKDGLTAKLLLNNKGPLPLVAKPTLIASNGDRFDAPEVIVEGRSFQMIDLRNWIQSAGQQFQEGSIQVFHVGQDLVLGAQIYLTNETESLSFDEKLLELGSFKSARMEGLWWLPDQKGEIKVAVSNTSGSALSVTIAAGGRTPQRTGQATFQLAARATRLLDVRTDILSLEHGAMSRYGGISVSHSGAPGDLLARGFVQDRALGYSLPIQFSDPAAAKSTDIQGVGLRLGSAGSDLLKPLVVLRNVGVDSTTVTGRMPYTREDGARGTVVFPTVRLSGGDSASIDIAQVMREQNCPWFDGIGGLEFTYSTAPGSVAIAALSVGDNGNQVFRVPMWDVAAQRSPTGGYPWYIDGSSSTTVYIKNASAEPQRYFLQVNYDGGAYAIGMKTLEGGETVTYDLRKVRDEQIPDSHGRTIPLEVSSGQVHWSGNGNGMMIGRSEQTDFVAGMSSNYSCMNCCSDNPDENHQTVIPGSATYAVDQSFLFTAAEQFMDCYGHFSEFVFVTNARWSSSNENVATVEQINGNATGASPGTATITARWDDCVNYYNPIFGECRCHTNHYSKSASVTVTAGIDRIQYQSGSDFVDVEGTLYVLNGTTVTFKAIPKPENATFPSGKPVWSGTSGISGTGQTKSVTFNTTSTSSTDYKTVIATAGVSITVNVVVIELTGVLTPDDNFAGHSTTRFGIHEHLTLGFTVTPTGLTAEQIGGLQWQKTSGSGELANAPTNGTGSFNVADSPGSATLQLKLLQGPSKESGPVSNLTVVAPSDGYVLKQPLSGIRHFQNYWSCGFLGNVYVLPNDVSFYNLFFREDDVGATASGWLSFLNGQSHDPGSPQGILNGIGGGLVNGDDQVFSGKYSDSNHGPYATGQVAWAIPWTYSVDFITWHSIRVVDQIASSTSTGRCTISKTGSGSFSSELSDPDSEW